jgi:RecA-family ATPase
MNTFTPFDAAHVALVRRDLTAKEWVWTEVYSEPPPPIGKGCKPPVGADWTGRARNRGPLDPISEPKPNQLNTGILCDGLRAIDIDVDAPERAQAVDALAVAMLGLSPKRYRDNSPRKLRVYRASEGLPKKRSIISNTYKNSEDKLEKVEVLGYGQQFVAYGVHDSGVELLLENNGQPHNYSPTQVTPVTEEHITAFIIEAANIIGADTEEDRAKPGKTKAKTATSSTSVSSEPTGLPIALAPFNEADRPWLMAAVDAEAAQFAQLPSGGRNGILNAKAYSLGGYLREGFDREIMATALLEAAKACGYVTKHGLAETLATINRSLEEGSRDPRPMKSDRPALPPIKIEGEAEGEAIWRAKAQAQRAAAGLAGLPISGVGGPMPAASPFPAPMPSVTAPVAAPAPYPTFDASEFEGQPVPERQWLVKDFIPANAVTIFGGDGGTGKSLLALQIAVASVTGGEWLGMPVRAGQVLYLSAEDEKAEFHRRLSHITKAQDFSHKQLKGLSITTLAGADATLAKFSGGAMKTTPVFDELHKTLSYHRPTLLVLDNLADVFGGDEIKKHEVRAFMNCLSGLAIEFNMTVLLLAHPSQSGMTSGTGTSGNVAWNNSARSRLMLATSKTENVEIADMRELTVMKANYAAKGNKIIIQYEDGVFNKVAGTGSANNDLHTDNKFIELLKQYGKEGRDVSPLLAPREFAAHPSGNSISKANFKKAMNRLLGNGLISIETHGPPSHPRNKLVFNPPELALG